MARFLRGGIWQRLGAAGGAHAVGQPGVSIGNRDWQNLDFDAVRICHGLLPLPRMLAVLLDDFHDPDATGGGTYHADYQVVSDFHMLNSYAGLTIPLIASATATFLFRQFFLTVPDELAEAARIDSAGPLRFFKDVI